MISIGFPQNFLVLMSYLVFFGNLNILGNYQASVWSLFLPQSFVNFNANTQTIDIF